MIDFIKHLFLPQHTNNNRSKILHLSSLFAITISFVFLTILIIPVKTYHPNVLGISYSITAQELLDLTNKVRKEKNLAPLVLNEQLTQASSLKSSHMFSNNYWAHFAPDGTTPWSFIKSAGYNYLYAGENLGKGFTNSNDIVNAWMNSPTHKDNILSPKYTDIGFSVNEGTLLGEDTVLVVQMFGATQATAQSQVQSSSINLQAQVPVPEKPEQKNATIAKQHTQEGVFSTPLVNLPSATKNLVIVVFSFLLIALILDFLIIERKKVPRIVGHNIDHIVIITLFLMYVFLVRSGGIL